MTQKKSSKAEKIEEEVKVEEPDIDVKIEGDAPDVMEPPKEVKSEEDVSALRQQIEALKTAQDASKNRAAEAEVRAQQAASQLTAMRHNAEASQYDSVVTAMGAAQIEIDSAKRDIILSGAAQDYAALADAQERLAAAKTHMIGLEQSKGAYDAQQARPVQQAQTIEQTIDSYTTLTWDERNWLKQHPEAITDPRKNAKLNAAYFEAVDKNLQRGSRDYFNFIEEQLGYRQPEVQNDPQGREEEESSVMVAAPPSKSVPLNTGTGGKKTTFTLTKEEAEIAKLSGITPQEYVKQREIFKGNRKAHPDDYPER